MKKRQVMALILAAALALPNTGVVAGITGAPVTVEAASQASLELGNFPVYGDDNKSEVEEQLKAEVEAEDAVKKSEKKNTVGKVITVFDDEKWELLNGDASLTRGKNNTAKLRYTFPKDAEVTGNDWKKTADGIYYGDFDIAFEAVEVIAPATVLDNCKWPELTEKEYKAGGTFQAYWGDELKSGSSEYGTFSVPDTDAGTPNDAISVPVTLKLNPGYEFSADQYEEGASGTIADGAVTYTKNYTVKLNKTAIKNFEWPTITKESAVYGVTADTLVLTTSKDASKVQFDLYDETGKKTGSALNSIVLKKGSNKFKIKATAKDANSRVLEGDTWHDITINVDAPAMTKVEVQRNNNGVLEPIGGGVNGGTASDAEVKLSAVDTWSPVFADAAARDSIYQMGYQWYKDGAVIPGEDAKKAEYTVKNTAPGQYYCEVNAKVKGSATIDQGVDYKDQPAMSTQKVDVAFSAIDIDDAGVTTSHNDTLVYGNISETPTLTVPVKGLSSNAKMTLVVKSGDKDVTSEVKISGKSNAIENGKANFVITVDKDVDAGTYTYEVKVKDGSNSVTLTDLALGSIVAKQDVAIDTSFIKPANDDIEHGDAFEKLTGLKYEGGTTTLDKRKAQAVNEKVTFTVEDCKTNFTKGYFDAKAATKEIKAKLELKENYKKNYKLTGAGLADLATPVDDVKTANVSTPVAKKKITLGVENIEMLQGESLPTRKVTGADFLEADKIKVNAKGYSLYQDKTEIKNDVESLKAGNYLISVELEIVGANADNYAINGKSPDFDGWNGCTRTVTAALTIYESQHTVGFVTDGGNAIADIKVYHNNAIGTLPTPIRSGYKFLGWYADKNFATPVNASTKVTGDMILFAKWEKVSSTSGQTPGSTVTGTVKKGTSVKVSGESAGTYVVTSTAKKTVSYKTSSKTITKITIPAAIRINGVTYKVTKVDSKSFYGRKKLTKVVIASPYVTEIGTSAFSGCSKLKSVTFKTSKITKIGKSAFKGISKKSAIKVPKSKKTSYKKMLRKSGYTKTVK